MEQAARDDRPGLRAYWVLALLSLSYSLNLIDRKLVFILAQPIKLDLQLSDTQLGLLTGLAFTLVYSTAAIPIALLSERKNRSVVIASAIAVWSLLTAAGGFAASFTQLVLARMGVAIGEAGCAPPSHSLLGDYFPPARMATVLAIFTAGAPLGSMLGMLLGGVLNDLADWRTAMIVVGLPGLLLALLVLTTVKERPRSDPGTPSLPLAAGMRRMFASPTVRHILFGGALAMVGQGATGAFGPAYIMRTYQVSATTTGWSYGLFLFVAGTIGALLGGFLADRLRRRDIRWGLWLVAGAMACATPSIIASLFAPSYPAFLVLLAPNEMAGLLYAGPCFSAMHIIVGARMRAVSSAIFLFALTGVGASVGPLAAGVLSDTFAGLGYVNSLRPALAILAFVNLWAAAHFIIAAAHFGREQPALPTPATAA